MLRVFFFFFDKDSVGVLWYMAGYGAGQPVVFVRDADKSASALLRVWACGFYRRVSHNMLYVVPSFLGCFDPVNKSSITSDV